MHNLLILLFLFTSITNSQASESCGEALFNTFVKYKRQIDNQNTFPVIKKHFDYDAFMESAKEHYKKENITGLLFVSDNEINNKAQEFINTFNSIFNGVTGIYSFKAFCQESHAELFLELIEKNQTIRTYGIKYNNIQNQWKIDSFMLFNCSEITNKCSSDFKSEFILHEILFNLQENS